MYALRPHGANKALVAYLNKPEISNIVHNGELYIGADGQQRGGIHSILERAFYPHYKMKKRRKSKKPRQFKGSSRELGMLVDRELSDYVKTGKEPEETLSIVIVTHLEHMEHTLQACQVPLYVTVAGSERITQADLISQDKQGRLWMWEIKTGYNRSQAQRMLRGLRDVPNNRHNHWELQRHYTHKGLVEGGLPIYRSHVLNVYREDGGRVHAKQRSVPKWCAKLK